MAAKGSSAKIRKTGLRRKGFAENTATATCPTPDGKQHMHRRLRSSKQAATISFRRVHLPHLRSHSATMRDPTTSTVLYKILTPQEKADMPGTNWAGTALDVSNSIPHMLHPSFSKVTDIGQSTPAIETVDEGRLYPSLFCRSASGYTRTFLQPSKRLR